MHGSLYNNIGETFANEYQVSRTKQKVHLKFQLGLSTYNNIGETSTNECRVSSTKYKVCLTSFQVVACQSLKIMFMSIYISLIIIEESAKTNELKDAIPILLKPNEMISMPDVKPVSFEGFIARSLVGYVAEGVLAGSLVGSKVEGVVASGSLVGSEVE